MVLMMAFVRNGFFCHFFPDRFACLPVQTEDGELERVRRFLGSAAAAAPPTTWRIGIRTGQIIGWRHHGGGWLYFRLFI